jgi:RHS repeat-associated protein
VARRLIINGRAPSLTDGLTEAEGVSKNVMSMLAALQTCGNTTIAKRARLLSQILRGMMSHILAQQISPTANNRVTGWLYDAAGDVLKDDSHTYTYDAENRIQTVDGTTSYAYDGENNRVAELTGGTIQKEFLYDFQGRLMTEIGLDFKAARANIFVGNDLFAEDAPDPYRSSTPTATLLRIMDQVGTLRAREDIGANWVGACSSLPYGDAMNCSVDPSDMLFTSKERDSESELDYFGARYYNSTRGRWMSPDWSAAKQDAVPYATLTNPQSLNLYGYALDSPLRRADKDGHCDWCYSLAATLASYVASHPDLADAISKLGSSVGVKASVGVGMAGHVGAAKGELAAGGYISSTSGGLGVGAQGTVSGRVGTVGTEGTLQVPIVKDGGFVNPITNTTASATPTVSGEEGVSGSGLVTSQEASAGGAYGEGLVVGFELTSGTQEIKDVLSTLGNGLIFDARQFYQDWLTSKSCSYSGCFAPQITPGSK